MPSWKKLLTSGSNVSVSTLSAKGIKLISNGHTAISSSGAELALGDLTGNDGYTSIALKAAQTSSIVIDSGDIKFNGIHNQSGEATSLMINGSGVVGTRELGSNAFTSTTIGTTTNALTVDNSTLALNSGTTFNGSAARTISIKADGVGSAQIADDAINSEHYTDGSIDTAHIADLQITTAKIAADAVTAAKLADDAVVTANIVDLNVTTGKIAADAITGAKIADDAIDSEHLANASIDAVHLASSAVTTSAIADDNVTYSKIQNVSATNRILGRDSSGAGVIEEITPANVRTMINVADGATANTGTVTSVGTNTGLSGTVTTSGNLSLTLSDLPDMTATMVGADEFIVLDSSIQQRKAANEIGLSIFNNDSGFTTNTGTVDTSGTPADNDFAKFTDANTIEGRSIAETKSDLSLNNVENTAISTFAGTSNITTVGTISSGEWQGTAIASAYIAADAITGAKIADDAIDSEHYTDGSIDTAHLADGSITAAKIADGTVVAAEIANDAVTNDKLANISRGSIKVGGGLDAPTDLDAKTDGQILVGDGTDINSVAVSGDVTLANNGAVTIAADAVTYAKIQNVSATNRILGRDSSGAGVIEEITPANVRTMINVEDGATADQTQADINGLAITEVGTISSGVWNGTAIASAYIAGDAITGAKIADDAVDSEHYTDGSIDTAHIGDDQVTYAKIQNVSATNRILGRDSSGAGAIEEITPANVRTMINVEDGATADQTQADINGLAITEVGTISTGVWQGTAIASAYIAGDAIDGSKIADDAVDSEHIAADSIDAEHYAAGSVDTTALADDNVTYAKIQNVSATNRILGRDSAGAGVIEEITPANVRTMINVADGANAYSHPNHSGDATSSGDGAITMAAAQTNISSILNTSLKVGRANASASDHEYIDFGNDTRITLSVDGGEARWNGSAFIPGSDSDKDIGSAAKKWRHLHMGGSGSFDSHLMAHCLGIGTSPSHTQGEIRATNDITAYYSSDIRLKENIKPLEGTLEKIDSIRGVTYDWKELTEEERKKVHSHTGSDIGVIAQEVEKVFPDLVEDRPHGYKAVNYEKLSAVLLSAVKELKQEVEDLKKKIG